MDQPLQFVIPDHQSVEAIKNRLLRSFPFSDDGESLRQRYFCDTFDWRLHRNNLTLEEEHAGDQRRIVLRDLHTGAVQRWVDAIEMPRFADELPRGPFRIRLGKITAMRALLPLTELRSQTHVLRLRDAENKTIARIEIEAILDHDVQPIRMQILPIRGHPKPAMQLSRFVGEQLQLPHAATTLLDVSLREAGIEARSYSNNPYVELDPREPTREAVRRILLRLLDTIEDNLVGTREYVDTEFLHDLRVSVRRTRSLIGQVRTVFTPEEITPFRKEFDWLGSITGPCRDLDVYLLGFDAYVDAVPSELQPALEPVRHYLLRRHAEEQRRLVQWLGSTRFRALISNWRDFLAQPGLPYDDAPDARRQLRKVADEHIWRAYRRLRDRGREIRPGTRAAKVHRLRIHGKKLRYLMEFFRDLYPRKTIMQYVRALKELQNNLGAFHDYHVQAEALRQFANEMRKEELAPAETLIAIDRLMDDLHARQKQARKQFARIFEHYDRPRNRSIARKLFRPDKRSKQ